MSSKEKLAITEILLPQKMGYEIQAK